MTSTLNLRGSSVRRPTIAPRRLLAWAAGRRGDYLFALAACVLAAGVAAVVLKVWRGSLSVPFEYSSDDSQYQLMLVKATLEHGSWFTNPALGAPFGQELYDFAVGGDNLHFVLIRALGLFSSDAGLVANLFFIVSFPLAALSAFVVMRWARVSRMAALVCSVLYALSPYHFLRGEHHAFLAADYAVPLGCYLALAVAGGRPLFPARPGARSRWTARLSSVSVLSFAACVAVASTGNVYYAAFTLILVAGAALARLALERQPRSVAQAAVVFGLVLAVLGANLAPTIIYSSSHGRDQIVALRQSAESKGGGFTMGELALPIADHRVGAFAALHRRYEASSVPRSRNESYDAALGIVATVGFLWLLGVTLVRVLGGRPVAGRQMAGGAALIATLAFLFGTHGAGGALVAYLVTPQFREWNRLSIFIAFVSLLGVAYLLDRLSARAGRAGVGRVAMAAVAGCVLVVGVLDQTSSSFAPPYRRLDLAYDRDAAFVASIERRLPRGAEIFQLPYMPFPEGAPVYRMGSYDPLIGYLHSRHLRWSYGAMKGRPEDWPETVAARPPGVAVAAVAAAGLEGLWVDKAGYRPRSRSRMLGRFRAVTGVRPLESTDGRHLFFDLRALRDRIRRRLGPSRLAAVRDVTLRPTRVAAGAGVWPGEERSRRGQRSWWAVSQQARLLLVNPSRSPRRVVFSAVLHTSRRAAVRLTSPGGATEPVVATRRGVRIERRLLLPHGNSTLSFSIPSAPIQAPADSRTLYMRIAAPTFVERPLSWLTTAPGPGGLPCRPRVPRARRASPLGTSGSERSARSRRSRC